jgi:hypothetical protein
MKKEKLERICEILDTELSLYDYAKNYLMESDVEDFDDICEILLDEGALEVEIIYYREAMDYLMEHDLTLTDSLEIAEEMGYKPSDLNCCTLATLLATRNNECNLYRLRDKIEEIIEEEEEEDNEE